GLGKLIVIYDDNGISIDGKVSEWFADDTPKRFEAYGWHVIRDVDGHDPAAIDAALTAAIAETTRPSLLCCKTVIARGAPTKGGQWGAQGPAGGGGGGRPLRSAAKRPRGAFEFPGARGGGGEPAPKGPRLERGWNPPLRTIPKHIS